MPHSIQITETSPLLHDANCVYCHVDLDLGDLVTVCDSCQSPHHTDCWDTNGNRCSTFGCQNSSAVVQDYLQPTSVRTVRTTTAEQDLLNERQRQRRSYRPNVPIHNLTSDLICKRSTVLADHDERVNSVSWSRQPDGMRIASATERGIVRIWDTRKVLSALSMGFSRTPRQFQSNLGVISSIQWSPSDVLLAIAFRDGSISILDMENGGEFRRLAFSQSGLTDEFSSNVCWSPTGEEIAFGSSSGILQVWKVDNGEEVQPIRGHDGAINGVDWSLDGQRLLTGSSDGAVKVWDVNSGQVLVFSGHNSAVNCVAWSPNSQQIAFGCDDGLIRICDVVEEKEVGILREHTAPVSCVSWSPNGNFIASGSIDKSIRVWWGKQKKFLSVTHQHGDEVNSLSWSWDSKRLASGSSDATAQIWVLSRHR